MIRFQVENKKSALDYRAKYSKKPVLVNVDHKFIGFTFACGTAKMWRYLLVVSTKLTASSGVITDNVLFLKSFVSRVTIKSILVTLSAQLY